MEQPKLNMIIEKAIEEQRVSKKKNNGIVKTKADEVYHKKISYLISLLTPIIVAPLPDGDILTKYPIENEMYREQIQDWIMSLTKKHLKM